MEDCRGCPETTSSQIAIVIVVVAGISIISYIRASKPYRDAGVSRSETKEYLEAGISLFDNGNYEQAIEYLLRIPSGTPQYEEAQAKLQDSISEYIDYVQNTSSGYIQKGNYEAAYKLAKSACALLPDDATIKGLYADVYSTYLNAIQDKVDEYVQAGEYRAAIDYINSKQGELPDEPQLQTLLVDLQFEYQAVESKKALEQAATAAAEGNYVEAMRVITGAINEIGASETLTTRLSSYEDSYVSETIALVDSGYIKYDIDSINSCISSLEDALLVLPGNYMLQERLQFYKERLPIKPWEMASFTRDVGETRYVSEMLDNNLTPHYDVLVNNEFGSSLQDDTAVRDFYLNGEYSHLTGEIFRNYEWKDFDWGYPFIRIYCDEQLKCEIQIQAGDPPRAIDVDLSGVKVLRIEFDTYPYWGYEGNRMWKGGIENLLIYK